MLHFFARRLKEAKEKEEGFTLIELLVVVIIIGILAAVAIPVFLNQRQRAQDADSESAARNAATTMQALATDCNGVYRVAPACTAALTSADLTAAEATLAPYNPTVTVPGPNHASFTVAVVSDSGRTSTYSSTTGTVTTA